MIRERREEDLDRLCAVQESMNYPSNLPSGKNLREWLDEHDAEQSWVFDMAPVRVTPTKNVVGHVQIYRPAGEPSIPYWVEHTQKPADHLLAIGKLPVLELHGNGFMPKEFYEKFGFEEVPSGIPDVAPMIYTR